MNGAKRQSSAGEATRARIIAATLDTLQTDGFAGASARAIAKKGGFNQALIFYHFGSLDDLILATAAKLMSERDDRQRITLAGVTKLSDLVRLARELNAEDRASGEIVILTQILAGAAGNPAMGSKLYEMMEPSQTLLAQAVATSLGTAPVGSLVDVEKIALAMTSVFLGIELFDNLDPTRGTAEALFDTFEPLAALLDTITGSPGQS